MLVYALCVPVSENSMEMSLNWLQLKTQPKCIGGGRDVIVPLTCWNFPDLNSLASFFV